MGRPPCCDKVGIKKGPWTPEEDIILVSYIQEHGPGNWRSVPTNTGTIDEVQQELQVEMDQLPEARDQERELHPARRRDDHPSPVSTWQQAAIASYLPQRTDNDIKNYWNTHLKKKKMNKYMTNSSGHSATQRPRGCSTAEMSSTMTQVARFTHSTPSTYASSTKNISRLLESWTTRPSPKPGDTATTTPLKMQQHNNGGGNSSSNNVPMPQEELEESLLLFENLGGIGWNKDSSAADSSFHRSTNPTDNDETKPGQIPAECQQQPDLLSVLEKWLLDEATAGQQVEDLMELSDVAMF